MEASITAQKQYIYNDFGIPTEVRYTFYFHFNPDTGWLVLDDVFYSDNIFTNIEIDDPNKTLSGTLDYAIETDVIFRYHYSGATEEKVGRVKYHINEKSLNIGLPSTAKPFCLNEEIQVGDSGKTLKTISNFIENYVDIIYPIGSVYMTFSSADPADLFGGQWMRLRDSFLVGAGNEYEAEETGGNKTHTHNYGFQYGGYYRDIALEQNNNTGVLKYDQNNNVSISGYGTNVGSFSATVNNGNSTASIKDATMAHYRMSGNTSYTNNLPPYTAVYMWRRIA